MSLTRHALVPVDFSGLSLEALRGLKELGTPIEEITLLHIIDKETGQAVATLDLSPSDPKVEERLRRAVEAKLGEWRNEHLKGFDKVNVEVLTADNPAEAVCERAKALDASLIAITTHGRTGLKHLLMGSVAEHVVQRAPCPTLVMRLP